MYQGTPKPTRSFAGSQRFSHSSAPRRTGPYRPSSHRGGPSRFSRGGSGPRRGPARGFIDVSFFVKKASVVTKIETPPQNSFADFHFPERLNQNLVRKGYTTPTPIQDKAIPFILEGRDLIGLAHTGTGKTGAFLLPLLQKLLANPKEQLLVVAPTRELAFQIDSEFREFSAGTGILSAVCVGGMPIYRQIRELRRNPQVVIGTPGRLDDLTNRKVFSYSMFGNIVLDEVDHMLDLGFIEPIRAMLAQLPATRQSLFFSATMPPRIRTLASSFLKNPVTVDITTGSTVDHVEQDIIRVKDSSKKYDELRTLLARPGFERVLIFCETKREVQKIADALVRDGLKAESIHGDKRQRERQRALLLFRELHVNILVATDVAARGLDIKNISHVINYTLPQTRDDYIHRIGRTGRGGKGGAAFTFV